MGIRSLPVDLFYFFDNLIHQPLGCRGPCGNPHLAYSLKPIRMELIRRFNMLRTPTTIIRSTMRASSSAAYWLLLVAPHTVFFIFHFSPFPLIYCSIFLYLEKSWVVWNTIAARSGAFSIISSRSETTWIQHSGILWRACPTMPRTSACFSSPTTNNV